MIIGMVIRSNKEVTDVVNNKNRNVIDSRLYEFYAVKFETKKDNCAMSLQLAKKALNSDFCCVNKVDMVVFLIQI